MEITFNELKEKEVINVTDGKRMGRVQDVIFDKDEGKVLGVIIPGERKLFKKHDDIFIPIDELKRIGEDVILVKIYLNNDLFSNNRENKKIYTKIRTEVEKEK